MPCAPLLLHPAPDLRDPALKAAGAEDKLIKEVHGFVFTEKVAGSWAPCCWLASWGAVQTVPQDTCRYWRTLPSGWQPCALLLENHLNHSWGAAAGVMHRGRRSLCYARPQAAPDAGEWALCCFTHQPSPASAAAEPRPRVAARPWLECNAVMSCSTDPLPLLPSPNSPFYSWAALLSGSIGTSQVGASVAGCWTGRHLTWQLRITGAARAVRRLAAARRPAGVCPPPPIPCMPSSMQCTRCTCTSTPSKSWSCPKTSPPARPSHPGSRHVQQHLCGSIDAQAAATPSNPALWLCSWCSRCTRC